MSRRVDFRVSMLVQDKGRIKDTKLNLQAHLRMTIRQLLDSDDLVDKADGRNITPFPESIRVTHLREKLTWKRRLVRWLEERIR